MPRKNRSFFQSVLLRRRLSYGKIVQVEDNAKKNTKFFSIGIVEAPPILWKDSASRRQCQEKTEVFSIGIVETPPRSAAESMRRCGYILAMRLSKSVALPSSPKSFIISRLRILVMFERLVASSIAISVGMKPRRVSTQSFWSLSFISPSRAANQSANLLSRVVNSSRRASQSLWFRHLPSAATWLGICPRRPLCLHTWLRKRPTRSVARWPVGSSLRL